MKHFCSFEKSPDTVFRKNVSFLFNSCCKSEIFGNPWFPHQLSPTYFGASSLHSNNIFSILLCKIYYWKFKPRTPPIYQAGQCETISTLISHPFKEKAKIKLYKIKMKIKSKSKYTKVQPLIFFCKSSSSCSILLPPTLPLPYLI